MRLLDCLPTVSRPTYLEASLAFLIASSNITSALSFRRLNAIENLMLNDTATTIEGASLCETNANVVGRPWNYDSQVKLWTLYSFGS